MCVVSVSESEGSCRSCIIWLNCFRESISSNRINKDDIVCVSLQICLFHFGEKVLPQPQVPPALGFSNSNRSPITSSTQETFVPRICRRLSPQTIIFVSSREKHSSCFNGVSLVGVMVYFRPLHPPPFTPMSTADFLLIFWMWCSRLMACVQKVNGVRMCYYYWLFTWRFVCWLSLPVSSRVWYCSRRSFCYLWLRVWFCSCLHLGHPEHLSLHFLDFSLFLDLYLLLFLSPGQQCRRECNRP